MTTWEKLRDGSRPSGWNNKHAWAKCHSPIFPSRLWGRNNTSDIPTTLTFYGNGCSLCPAESHTPTQPLPINLLCVNMLFHHDTSMQVSPQWSSRWTWFIDNIGLYINYKNQEVSRFLTNSYRLLDSHKHTQTNTHKLVFLLCGAWTFWTNLWGPPFPVILHLCKKSGNIF